MLDPFESFVYFEFSQNACPTRPSPPQAPAALNCKGDRVHRLVDMLSAALKEWFPSHWKYGKLP